MLLYDSSTDAINGINDNLDGVSFEATSNLTYYVDSVNGSDSNDGLTSGTALASLNAVLGNDGLLKKKVSVGKNIHIAIAAGIYGGISIGQWADLGYVQLSLQLNSDAIFENFSLDNIASKISINGGKVETLSISNCNHAAISNLTFDNTKNFRTPISIVQTNYVSLSRLKIANPQGNINQVIYADNSNVDLLNNDGESTFSAESPLAINANFFYAKNSIIATDSSVVSSGTIANITNAGSAKAYTLVNSTLTGSFDFSLLTNLVAGEKDSSSIVNGSDFDDSIAGLGVTTKKEAIDQLASRLTTVEGTSSDLADFDNSLKPPAPFPAERGVSIILDPTNGDDAVVIEPLVAGDDVLDGDGNPVLQGVRTGSAVEAILKKYDWQNKEVNILIASGTYTSLNLGLDARELTKMKLLQFRSADDDKDSVIFDSTSSSVTISINGFPEVLFYSLTLVGKPSISFSDCYQIDFDEILIKDATSFRIKLEDCRDSFVSLDIQNSTFDSNSQNIIWENSIGRIKIENSFASVSATNNALVNLVGSSYVIQSSSQAKSITGQAYNIEANSVILGTNPITGTIANTIGDFAVFFDSNPEVDRLDGRISTVETASSDLAAQKGQPNGIAELDANGTVPTAQLPIINLLETQLEVSSNFTAQKSTLNLVNCSNGLITIAPPPTPVSGDRFAVADSRSSSEINNIVVNFGESSQNLYGTAQTYTLNQNGAYVEFFYSNSAIGWIAAKGSIMATGQVAQL